MRPTVIKVLTESGYDRTHAKNQGTKMLGLNTIELQVPMGDIVRPIAAETIAVWGRSYFDTKRKDR